MVFSSMTFLALFFPLVFLLHFLFKDLRIRNAVLLVFSLVFYAWGEPLWIFIMLLTVSVNYLCGRLIGSTEEKSLRKLFVGVAVVLSLGFLFLFKYFGFFTDVLCGLFGIENTLVKPTLPIGISFYTFQVITYTVDVYRRKVGVQKSFSRLLLYVSFFPQLIAGPIVNYTDIAASLDKRRTTGKDLYEGFLRFFIGFVKKVLIANTCGVITDKLSAGDALP